MLSRRILSVICALIIVAISCYNMSFAKEKKKGTKQETSNSALLPKKEQHNYATMSFDPKVTSLPSDYHGHDIIALYDRLSKAFPPKDEFESIDTYRNRLAGTCPQDIFAFVDHEKNYVGYASYNPDMQIMDVRIDAESERNKYANLQKLYYDWSNYNAVIVTMRINGISRVYEAGNKFGAKTVVTEHTGQNYGISLINKSSFSKLGQYAGSIHRKISIKIAPEEGRELKTNLGILLICKVALGAEPPAYFFESFYHFEPTMDFPRESNYQQFFVNVDLFEIWVFNKRQEQFMPRKSSCLYLNNKRKPIPSEIKCEVWRRNQGKCTKCESRINLEYDHIIPISTGGSYHGA